MSEPGFAYDVFLSHSAKYKAVVRSFCLSASNGEREFLSAGGRPAHSGFGKTGGRQTIALPALAR